MIQKLRSKAVQTAKRAPAVMLGPPVPSEALLGYRLWQVEYGWHRHLERSLSGIGLTHLNYVLLSAVNSLIRNHEIPSQIRLSNYTKVEKMMVSKNLRVLEQRGYLARTPSPNNRRANEIALTAKGIETLRKAYGAATQAQTIYFSALGDDYETLNRLLQRVMATDPGEKTSAK